MSVKYSGFISLIGRPNVGKSTLLNELMGKKLSITSHKPQTTRQNLYGIMTQENRQAVFVDTPGMHLNAKRKINHWMNKQAKGALADVDVALFMVDAGVWTEEDEAILQNFHEDTFVVLIVNKIDGVKDRGKLLPYIENIASKYPFKHIVPISAFRGDNLEELKHIIFQALPESPFYFPEDMVCSHGDPYRITEIIREKIMRTYDKEIPYCTNVQIEATKQHDNHLEIHALIWVEREGQKRILIGHKGEQLKTVGTHARRDIEKLIGQKVMLKLWIKVKEGWADSDSVLSQLGFA